MKKYIVRTALVLGFLYLGLYIYGSPYVEPIFEVRAEVEIDAPVDQVWKILEDISAYPDWNPYVPRIDGVLKPGETLLITIIDGNFEGPLVVSAVVAEVNKNQSFYWEGTFGISGLHDTRHYFVVEPMPDGRTKFIQYEEFRGVLALLTDTREKRIGLTRNSFVFHEHRPTRKSKDDFE